MTRAADPTSVLCKRYSMYEPGKRVARGWNARRRTSGESRDTVQRRYKERRGGRVEGWRVEEERRKERRAVEEETTLYVGVRRLPRNALTRYPFTVPARSFVRHRAERSRAERFASSLATGNAQTHASLPRDQTANTVGLPLRCDNSLIARKDTRRAQPTLSAAAPFSLSLLPRGERERSVPIWKRETW